jgi:hypothetical protein
MLLFHVQLKDVLGDGMLVSKTCYLLLMNDLYYTPRIQLSTYHC